MQLQINRGELANAEASGTVQHVGWHHVDSDEIVAEYGRSEIVKYSVLFHWLYLIYTICSGSIATQLHKQTWYLVF